MTTVRKWLAEILGWLVRGASRIVLLAAESPGCRFRLGQVSVVLRSAAEANDALRVKAAYAIDPTVSWGSGTRILGAGKITIGESTYLGTNCFVVAEPADAKITIGRSCAISHSVHVRTASYRTDIPFERALDAPLASGDVSIGDHVWIGAHAVITGGVAIGSNSVVGANSVVTRNVPANSVYGGVPARPLHNREATPG